MIDVQEPTVTVGTISTGTPKVFVFNWGQNPDNHWHVEAADPTANPPEEGIKVPVSVKLPGWITDPSSGTWGFTQLLNSSDKIALGPNNWHAPMNGTLSLDGGFPWPGTNILDPNGNKLGGGGNIKTSGDMYTFFDTPQDDLTAPFPIPEDPVNGTKIDHDTRYDQYTTYVMFQAPGSGSQWVPVKVLNWSWNIDVIKNNSDAQVPPIGTWMFRSVTPPAYTGPNAPTAEPLWSQLWALTQWADG